VTVEDVQSRHDERCADQYGRQSLELLFLVELGHPRPQTGGEVVRTRPEALEVELMLVLSGRHLLLEDVRPSVPVLDLLRQALVDSRSHLRNAHNDALSYLDPFAEQEGSCVIPVSLGFPPAFDARELLTGTSFTWRAGRNYVKLGPGKSHLLKVLA